MGPGFVSRRQRNFFLLAPEKSILIIVLSASATTGSRQLTERRETREQTPLLFGAHRGPKVEGTPHY